MYAKYLKRPFDLILSLTALVILSPVLLLMAAVGAVTMKGNPFFLQERTGKIDPETGREKIFTLIKYRTMTNECDRNGILLPDEKRLNRYGLFLRATSLDELPELVNILKGDMSIVGPRPLLVKYIPLYSEQQRHRHDVRPGLTGLAQVHGRNGITWQERFHLDTEYVGNISFTGDVKIILETAVKVFRREGISSETAATMEGFTGNGDT